MIDRFMIKTTFIDFSLSLQELVEVDVARYVDTVHYENNNLIEGGYLVLGFNVLSVGVKTRNVEGKWQSVKPLMLKKVF